MLNALFVNSGLLGQRVFARFVQRAFVEQSGPIRSTQITLTDELSGVDRAIRRVMCQRIWPERAPVRNVDLFRYRAEWHSGLLARRRIAALERGRAERFDVLHFHHHSTAYASVARMRRTPTIISIDCTQHCLGENARHALEAWSYRPGFARDGTVFRAASLIVTMSEWAAQSLRDEYADLRAPIVVKPTPVDFGFFDPKWIAERHRRALVPGYRPRVLFIGGDFVRKGGEDLLDAWRVADLGRRATLDVVTGAAIDERLLSDGIHVHAGVQAYTPEWVDLWRRADVFVLPTREEAFGMVFQEAAAAGLPLIGTNIMAIPELIEHGRTGSLVRPRDTRSLVAALDELLSSAELRRDFGVRARAHAERTADAERYREWLADTMRRLARQ